MELVVRPFDELRVDGKPVQGFRPGGIVSVHDFVFLDTILLIVILLLVLVRGWFPR
jgi:hypothetical protein